MTQGEKNMRKALLILLCGLFSLTVATQEPIELGDSVLELTPATEADLENAGHSPDGDYVFGRIESADRITYQVSKLQRGTTLNISEDDVIDLCGDIDGCSLRLGMYDWDGQGRVASRESLLYYNYDKKTWQASRDDLAGTNMDARIQHVMEAWSCYFTDGLYLNWSEQGDPDLRFGLLSWNQYNAGCLLTIID